MYALILIVYLHSGKIMANEAIPPQRFETYDACETEARRRQAIGDGTRIGFSCIRMDDEP